MLSFQPFTPERIQLSNCCSYFTLPIQHGLFADTQPSGIMTWTGTEPYTLVLWMLHMVNKLFLDLSELPPGSGCFCQRCLMSRQLSSPVSWDMATPCLCSRLKEDEAFQERLSFMFVLWWWMIEPCGFSVFTVTDKLFPTPDHHASGSSNGSQVWHCTRLGGSLRRLEEVYFQVHCKDHENPL